MPMKIQLHFDSDGKKAILSSIYFSHPLLESSIASVRGKGIAKDTPTFLWSSAVVGLSIIILEAAKKSFKGSSFNTPVLSGHSGSPASSLDYAINKRPRWLLDCFGTDSKGESILKRIIKRTNSERKQPGPVVFYITEDVKHGLEIFLDGQLVETAESQSHLLSLLGSSRRTQLKGALKKKKSRISHGDEQLALRKRSPLRSQSVSKHQNTKKAAPKGELDQLAVV